MPRAKPNPERKSRSGSYVPEELRGTVRARVPKEHAEALASRWACSPQEAVVRAVREAAEPRPLTAAEDEAACRADAEYDRMRERDLEDR